MGQKRLIEKKLMKIVVRIADAVELAAKIEQSPTLAIQEIVQQVRDGFRDVLEQVMSAELDLFLGNHAELGNKRNGYTTRNFAIKGVGSLQLRVPRDRAGKFSTKLLPANRRYDDAIARELATLHLAGVSTRMLSYLSPQLVGVGVSAQEVSNCMQELVPAAKTFLNRPLADREWIYLYVDGTNFHVRRLTVEKEPTLVVLGVDATGMKSVLSMIQGDKDNRRAWEAVFADLKERGLNPSTVKLGIMDGLPGLENAFREAFTSAKTARCWIHKNRNVMPRVPHRYQERFQPDWDAVQYAPSLEAARASYATLVATWGKLAGDAVDCMAKDIEALLVHYTFPESHWNALRTTNPIERINKEFKRRSRAMEVIGAEGLKVLLAFTALRLEYGWATTPIDSNKLSRRKFRENKRLQLEAVRNKLLN